MMVLTSVSDTDSLITYPDPAFGLNTDPDPGFWWWSKFENKFTATGEAFSPQKREHPALQNMKFLNFFVGHFCPLGSGSTDLIESVSETLVRTHAHCLWKTTSYLDASLYSRLNVCVSPITCVFKASLLSRPGFDALMPASIRDYTLVLAL